MRDYLTSVPSEMPGADPLSYALIGTRGMAKLYKPSTWTATSARVSIRRVTYRAGNFAHSRLIVDGEVGNQRRVLALSRAPCMPWCKLPATIASKAGAPFALGVASSAAF